jgi:hypothetical protein
MTPESAQIIALQALFYVTSDEQRLSAFVAKTGVGVGDLKEGARQPAFLGGILDFLLEDEASLLAFCENVGIPPETPIRARAALPGAAFDW